MIPYGLKYNYVCTHILYIVLKSQCNMIHDSLWCYLSLILLPSPFKTPPFLPISPFIAPVPCYFPLQTSSPCVVPFYFHVDLGYTLRSVESELAPTNNIYEIFHLLFLGYSCPQETEVLDRKTSAQRRLQGDEDCHSPQRGHNHDLFVRFETFHLPYGAQ